MTEPTLPCKVCQEPSTGVHYGVLSCHACKGFFARQLNTKNRKKCLGNGNCKVKLTKKHACASCRFRRCLAVGMSKTAIKTGRYTLQWRYNVKTELQHLEETRAREAERRHQVELQERLQSNFPLGPDGETVQEIIDSIVRAYKLYIPSNIWYSQEYLDGRAGSYWEYYRLKERLFGRMSALSDVEFDEIFSKTGLDVDDRLPFSETYLNSWRRWICKVVRFSKMVPGFKQLCMEDQFNLLKYNRFEFWFLGAYRGYNPRLSIAVNPNGLLFHQEDMRKTCAPHVNQMMFDVAKSLQRTNLTPEEHVITQTMALFFADRAPLEDRSAVEALQLTLLTCLEHLVRRRPCSRHRVRGLGQACDMLTNVRELGNVDNSTVAKEGWIHNIQCAQVDFLKYEMDLGHSSQNEELKIIK